MRVEPPIDVFVQSGLSRLTKQGLSATMGRSASGIRSVLVQRGRHYIRISPTLEDWSAFYHWNPRWEANVRIPTGRVESGDMLEAFTSSQTNNGDTIELRVGWLDGDEDYYAYQELGFNWAAAGPNGPTFFVPGMNVLEQLGPDLDKMVADSLERHMKNYLESFGG